MPIIQGLWIGPKLSKMEQLCIKSYLAHGHTFHLYTYETVIGIPEGVVVKDATEILGRDTIFRYQNGPERGSLGGFANMFRYKLLFDKGGYWVDMDTVCLKHFDFPGPYVFMSQLDEGGKQELSNGIMLAPLGNDLCSDAFNICMAKDKTKMTFGQTGPVLIRALVKKYKLEKYAMGYKAFCPVHYYELGKIVTTCDNLDEFMDILMKDSYAVHLWNEIWRRKGVDKNGTFPPNSVYRRFLDMYGL